MLLGFSAVMGGGKSEAIRELEKHTSVHLVKFAQPLYDMQEFIYGRISSVVKRDHSFVKDRKLLQWLGTEWGRDSVSKTLWVDLWKAKVEEIKAADRQAIIVCDDVRFENEAETFKELGGVIVRINTNRNHERIDTAAGIKNHSSEAGLPAHFHDFVIDNNGTLEEYRDKLTTLYAYLGLTKGK